MDDFSQNDRGEIKAFNSCQVERANNQLRFAKIEKMITTKAAYLIDYEKHGLKLSIVVVHVNLLKLSRNCIWVS